MTNILLAINALLALTESAARIATAIQRARAEGRDITDAELMQVRELRRQAVAQLLETGD